MKSFQFRQVLRVALTHGGSARQVSMLLFGNYRRKTTIQKYRNRAAARKETWASLQNLRTAELRARYCPRGGNARPNAAPNFQEIDQALQHPGMTLQTYWEERRDECPENTLSYSRLAFLYKQHRKTLPRSMRQRHVPGEKCFVDFSGELPWYFDQSGEKIEVELFVGALAASGFVFARCVRSQTVPDWLSLFPPMFSAFGGVPQALVPDNLKSAVTRAGSDPLIQRTFLEMAEHYGVAVWPARPRRAKDKAKAEGSVLLMQRAFLPLLRHHRCGSLEELNVLLEKRVAQVNAKGFQKRKSESRASLWARLDRPALRPIPAQPFVYAYWTAPRLVPADYHIAIESHWYSVPHTWVGQTVEVKVTAAEVVIVCDGVDEVRHPLSTEEGGQTTNPEHMLESHRAQLDRTPEKLLAWADGVGPHTAALMRAQFARKVPLQGLAKADQIKTLSSGHSPAALEHAAERAMALGVPNPTGFRRVLAVHAKAAADARLQGAAPANPVAPPPVTHRPRRNPRSRSAGAPASAGVPLVPHLPTPAKRKSR